MIEITYAAGALLAIALGWLFPIRGRFDLNLLPDLLSAAVFLLTAIVVVIGNKRRLPVPVAASWAFGGLAIWAILSLGYGAAPYKDVALHGPLALAMAWFAASMGFLFGNSERVQKMAAAGVLLSALLTAGSVYQQAGLRVLPDSWVIPVPIGERPVGNFFQPNLSALAMSLGWFAALYLAFAASSPRLVQRVGLPVVGGAFSIAVCFTGSRAGLLLLLLGTFIGACTLARPFRRSLIVMACCLTGIALAYSIGPAIAQHLIEGEAFTKGSNAVERMAEGEGFALRLAIMKHGIEQSWAHPLVGGGWASHAGWVFDHAGELRYPRYSTNTHNIGTQLVGELGLIGVLIGFIPLGWLCRNCFKKMPTGPWVGWLVLISFHSLLEYPLWNVSFLLLFAWSWGAAESQLVDATKRRTLPVWLASVVLAVGVGIAGWMAWGLSKIVNAQERTQVIPVSTYPLLSAYTDLLLFRSIRVSEDRIAEKIELGERVLHFAPQDWIIERQILLLTLSGNYSKAELYRGRLLKMYYWRAEDLDKRIDASMSGIKKIRERLGR